MHVRQVLCGWAHSKASSKNILGKIGDMGQWVKVLATKPADLKWTLTDTRLHQKSNCSDPGRNKNLQETRCPPIGCQRTGNNGL